MRYILQYTPVDVQRFSARTADNKLVVQTLFVQHVVSCCAYTKSRSAFRNFFPIRWLPWLLTWLILLSLGTWQWRRPALLWLYSEFGTVLNRQTYLPTYLLLDCVWMETGLYSLTATVIHIDANCYCRMIRSLDMSGDWIIHWTAAMK